MIPLTSDSGNYIIVRDLDTSEDFKLFSNDPVSRDLTIFVDQSSGCYYILPGNLMRRIEIRNETHSVYNMFFYIIMFCQSPIHFSCSIIGEGLTKLQNVKVYIHIYVCVLIYLCHDLTNA